MLKRDYQKICNLPVATEFYDWNKTCGTYCGTYHIKLPEWYIKALGVSKCEHCLRNCKTPGLFHMMNFKCQDKIKNSTKMYYFDQFIDFIYIKENSVHQTFKLMISMNYSDKFEVPTTQLKINGAYKLIIKEEIRFWQVAYVCIKTQYNLNFLDSIFFIDLKEIISKYIIQNTEIAWLEHNVLNVSRGDISAQENFWPYNSYDYV